MGKMREMEWKRKVNEGKKQCPKHKKNVKYQPQKAKGMVYCVMYVIQSTIRKPLKVVKAK